MTSSAPDAVLSFAETLGASSLAWFWAPAAAWTVVAVAVVLAVGRWGAQAPALAYRSAQATLLALPLGIALALVVDPSWLPSWRAVPVVVDSGPASVLLPAPAGAVAPVVSAPSVAWAHVLAGVLVLAAGVVAVVGLARLVVQAVRLGLLRRALPAVEVEGLGHDVTVARGRVGLRRAPQVLVTSADVVPMTLGVRCPLVVVPASLGRADRRLALAHEFVHVRHGDPLAHAAEVVTAAVFGLHPLVHALTRQCDLHREMACDAAVLAAAATDRRSYAALVSSFATRAHRLAAPALGMAARRLHVHQRLIAMTQPRSTSRFAVPLALTLLTAAVVTVMAGSAVAQPVRLTIDEAAAVVYVDGERVPGGLDAVAIDPADIYTVDVTKEDGGDSVVRIVTRAAARARGLPVDPGGIGRERFESDDPDASFSFTVRDSQTETVRGELVLEHDAEGEGFTVTSNGGMMAGGVVVRESAAGPRLFYLNGEEVPQDAVQALDPSEIASIEVLRGDPAVTAYGPVGADGVILVVTKSEDEGAARMEALSEGEEAPAGFAVGVAQPNPTDDAIQVPVSLAEAQDVRFRVYDLAGRLVLEEDRALPVGASRVTFDVSELAPGAYIVRATGTADGQRVLARSRFTVAR